MLSVFNEFDNVCEVHIASAQIELIETSQKNKNGRKLTQKVLLLKLQYLKVINPSFAFRK